MGSGKKESFILIVVEGKKLEPKIIDSINKNLQIFNNEQIKFCYETHIYDLYKRKRKEENKFKTLLSLLKEKKEQDESFKDIDDEQIVDRYLFFDHDVHHHDKDKETNIVENNQKVKEMLEFFDTAGDKFKGKLYISYPMAEAIKDGENCDNCKLFHCYKTVYINDNKHYKENIGCKSCYTDILNLTKQDWQHILTINWNRANQLMKLYPNFVFSENSLMQPIDSQQDIFYKQKIMCQKSNEVAVLSAFPLFILEYLNNENKQKLIENLSK